ncbi:competence type IV pilus assembly protein ComGB [Evansella cellulosilytica]|uniref:Type II secretion system F domain n=1 Tax=Evansella cellulosilytica (strain ATCC 21833 / DSM 2522 / FERM P-1141 / JCM 9156 / N-4) TaxID=649639 RepID=E6TWY8_EVAC2|nr:competence type IV pilus assembly protein ComGB [Evansella cellulosilytica]ADU29938.1 Type II secretion system F domain [Evansella cellulosilytica DSM 2522]
MKKAFKNDLERSEWLYQMYLLMTDGYSLAESIQLIMEYSTTYQKAWCESIYIALVEGEDFSSQLKSAAFSTEVVSYLYLSEKYGDLINALFTTSKLLKNKHDLKKKSQKLLTYPLFLFTLLLIMITILSEGIFPQLTFFFESSGQELPIITRLVMFLLSFLQLPFIIFFLLILCSVLIWFNKKSIEDRYSLLCKYPVIRNVTSTYLTYSFVTQLSPLLKNGFSLYNALKVIVESSHMKFLQIEASAMIGKLLDGYSLQQIIKERGIYDERLTAVIYLGESKGKLGEEFERFGNFIYNKQQEKIYKVISVAQPVIVSVIGLIVLVLFLSIMVPIFNIVDGW